MMFCRSFAALLAFTSIAQSSVKDVDFSNYNKPLYTQIVDRIKAKISARLGEGPNTRDRYFIIPFAYQNEGNDPEF